MLNRKPVALSQLEFHFAPSALGNIKDPTWAVGPGFYISRLWRWEAWVLSPPHQRSKSFPFVVRWSQRKRRPPERSAQIFLTQEGCHSPFWQPSGLRNSLGLPTGGLRYAATTGYYLTAFQAETPIRIALLSKIGP
jgi:hypothetical protein